MTHHRQGQHDSLVSVILPVKDGGVFLAGAVASILSQTHTELEMLLVDDHSEDGAVEALASTDHRLKLLTSPGKGVVEAFNHGLAHAQGNFIARMDADDIALPERIEQQLVLLASARTVDICGTGVSFFPRTSIAGGNRHYQHWLNELTEPVDIHRQMFIESPIPNPTAMFRRQAIERLEGYHDTPWPEDYDLFLRADQAGMEMAKTHTVLLHWREHDSRLTRTDERYSRHRFQQAKAHYLAAGRLPQKPFLIWGGGPTGAEMFDLLQEQGRTAGGFLDVHPRRIGGLKRGKPVIHFEQAIPASDHFILVAVGARHARTEIRQYLDRCASREGDDYLFVA